MGRVLGSGHGFGFSVEDSEVEVPLAGERVAIDTGLGSGGFIEAPEHGAVAVE
jgi:hypothetical protein